MSSASLRPIRSSRASQWHFRPIRRKAPPAGRQAAEIKRERDRDSHQMSNRAEYHYRNCQRRDNSIRLFSPAYICVRLRLFHGHFWFSRRWCFFQSLPLVCFSVPDRSRSAALEEGVCKSAFSPATYLQLLCKTQDHRY